MIALEHYFSLFANLLILSNPFCSFIQGCGKSKSKKVASVNEDDDVCSEWKTLHSVCRWNKDWGKLERTLKKHPECTTWQDPRTGNFPLHITCQNGHEEVTAMLIEHGADVNAQNGKGQTALHMAMSYDYYRVVRMLLDGGADKEKLNDDGFEAVKGLEGNKTMGLVCFSSCENGEDIDEALTMVEGELAVTDKVDFIKAGLNLKKRFEFTDPPLWTDLEQRRFKQCLSQISRLQD